MPKYTIPVLSRAIRLLDAIAAGKVDTTAKGLSLSLKIPQTTCYRILQTFVDVDWLRPMPGGTYAISYGMYRLLEPSSKHELLIKMVEEPLRKLGADLNESVMFSVYDQGKFYPLLRIEGNQELKVSPAMKAYTNLYQTASGRVMLGRFRKQEVERYVTRSGLPGAAWKEVATREELHTHLAAIRKSGSAIVYKGDITGIATSIYKPESDLNAAIGVYLPTSRFNNTHRERIIAGLHETSQTVLSMISR